MNRFLFFLKSEFAVAFNRALNFWLPVFSVYCGALSLIFVLVFTSEIWAAISKSAPFHGMAALTSVPLAFFFAYGARGLWRVWRNRMRKR